MSDKPTVLVVDDNQDLLNTFAMILKRRGFSVQTAGNGISAVDKFKEQSFDVTLMDIVMPEMNGVDASKKIKEIQPGASIILMTAYSDEELIQTARDEGVRQIIHKPIRIDQLIELINEAAAGQPILIVDDDDDICETLTKILEIQGYDVLAAGSGEEAVILAQEKDCQMAFIDVKLPNIDGLETLLRLKEMNPDILPSGERCASTSNRNFEGRQGKGGRTHLVSPLMAAAAAVAGHFVDIREWGVDGAE